MNPSVRHIPYALFLGCYDREEHLALHLDIAAWHAVPAFIIYQGPHPPTHHPEPLRHCPPRYPLNWGNQGAGFALVEALTWAAELGVGKMVYSNCDDLCFNIHWREATIFHHPHDQFVGYNWLNRGVDHEFAVNEVVMDVQYWKYHIDAGWRWFRNRGQDVEHNLGSWRRECGSSWARHPHRERDWGVGSRFGLEVPDNFRWFNRIMGMIGFHNLSETYEYYLKICSEDYMVEAEVLESMPRFGPWVEAMSKL
jgi:hypothetical protein